MEVPHSISRWIISFFINAAWQAAEAPRCKSLWSRYSRALCCSQMEWCSGAHSMDVGISSAMCLFQWTWTCPWYSFVIYGLVDSMELCVLVHFYLQKSLPGTRNPQQYLVFGFGYVYTCNTIPGESSLLWYKCHYNTCLSETLCGIDLVLMRSVSGFSVGRLSCLFNLQIPWKSRGQRIWNSELGQFFRHLLESQSKSLKFDVEKWYIYIYLYNYIIIYIHIKLYT